MWKMNMFTPRPSGFVNMFNPIAPGFVIMLTPRPCGSPLISRTCGIPWKKSIYKLRLLRKEQTFSAGYCKVCSSNVYRTVYCPVLCMTKCTPDSSESVGILTNLRPIMHDTDLDFVISFPLAVSNQRRQSQRRVELDFVWPREIWIFSLILCDSLNGHSL